jgi:hypothetical protein
LIDPWALIDPWEQNSTQAASCLYVAVESMSGEVFVA